MIRHLPNISGRIHGHFDAANGLDCQAAERFASDGRFTAGQRSAYLDSYCAAWLEVHEACKRW